MSLRQKLRVPCIPTILIASVTAAYLLAAEKPRQQELFAKGTITAIEQKIYTGGDLGFSGVRYYVTVDGERMYKFSEWDPQIKVGDSIDMRVK
ncbi:hypothetical protein HYU11_05115 [Candidatus Woesearchaeota archaeon]|nr:hypothetical protein [Candidatus Woesearchaeota archaeon]